MRTNAYALIVVLVLTTFPLKTHSQPSNPETWDYLIITTDLFLQNSMWDDMLLSSLTSRGFTPGIESVGEGITADSLSSIIAEYYFTDEPIQYVFLVGGGKNLPGKIDPKDPGHPYVLHGDSSEVVDYGAGNYLPFHYVHTNSIWDPQGVLIATDDPYIADLSGRGPVAIGRLPAESNTQILNYVEKLTTYVNGFRSFSKHRTKELYLGLNVDLSWNHCTGSLVDQLRDDMISNHVPAFISTDQLNVSAHNNNNAFDYSAAREQLFEDKLNQEGFGLISMLSTSGGPVNFAGWYWADQSDFAFTNSTALPFVVGTNCHQGEVNHPEAEVTTRKLMLHPDGGIIGAFGPTDNVEQHRAGWALNRFHDLVFQENESVLGTIGWRLKKELGEAFPKYGYFYQSLVTLAEPALPVPLIQKKSGTITTDQTWKGSILVAGELTVDPNVTLTITPGTGVFFQEGAALVVNGGFEVQGTAEAPVAFAAASTNPTPGYWKGIIIKSETPFSIANATIRDADYGLQLLGVPGGGLVQHSTITSNNTGIYVEQVESETKIQNCTIGPNEEFGIWAVASPKFEIVHNIITQNKFGGLYLYRRSQPLVKYNEIHNNGYADTDVYDGIAAVDGSDFTMYGVTQDEAEHCQANNVLYHNARAGIFVSDESYPKLGMYDESDPFKYGGYNRIFENNITVWNRNREELYAQVNYWTEETSGCPNSEPFALQGERVIWEPSAPVGGLGKRSSFLTTTGLRSAIEAEIQHDDSLAYQAYLDLIQSYPDSQWVGIAVNGLVRVMERLEFSIPDIITTLQGFRNNYQSTPVALWALDGIATQRVRMDDYAQAMNYVDTLSTLWNDSSRTALYLYEQAWLTEKMEGAGLGKLSTNTRQLYNAVLSRHPSSPIAVQALAKLGTENEEMPSTPPLPESFHVSRAYPNPFNPTTTIDYQLPSRSHVTVNIYDVRGRLVKSLSNIPMPAGYHHIQWDGKNKQGTSVATGVYFIEIRIQPQSPATNFMRETRKIVYLK